MDSPGYQIDALRRSDSLDDEAIFISSPSPSQTDASRQRQHSIDDIFDSPPRLMAISSLTNGSPPELDRRRYDARDIWPSHPPPQPSSRAPASVAVIDLTAEPDSPVEEQRRRAANPPRPSQSNMSQTSSSGNYSQGSRNPRRTSSIRISPPSLERSDSTFVGPSVIDLTEDSPEEHQPRLAFPSPHIPLPQPRTNVRLRNRGRYRPPLPHPDELIDLELIQHQGSVPATFANGLGSRLLGVFGMAYSGRGMQPLRELRLDVTQTAFDYVNGRPVPKPVMEPVPETRIGFARNTCAEPEDEDDDKIFVCPACGEELAYDPTGGDASGVGGSGSKRKRAAGDHHFWALKRCGHVYCVSCFENRRPTKTKPRGVGFPVSNGVEPLKSPSDIRCIVDGCDTKVSSKNEWIGIYL